MEKDLHNLSQIAFQLSVLDIAISSSRDKHTVKSLDIRKDSEGLREENSQKSKQISLCELQHRTGEKSQQVFNRSCHKLKF